MPDGDVGSAPLTNWWDDRANLIAFSRGSKGWISINNRTAPQTRTFATRLHPGVYCDIIHGDYADGTCSGPTVTVGANGSGTVSVPAQDAVAFDAGNVVRD